MNQLLRQPAPLELPALPRRQLAIGFSFSISKVIEECGRGHEPAVLPAETLHQFAESRDYGAIFNKPVAEMRVHDAGPAFFFKSILIRFIHSRQKSRALITLRGSKTEIDPWTCRIVIWHLRTCTKGVDLAKDEIAAIPDLRLA